MTIPAAADPRIWGPLDRRGVEAGSGAGPGRRADIARMESEREAETSSVTLRNSGTELEREDYWASARTAADRGLEFGDFLDLINPLQHIPVIGSLYRELTGDEIAPPVRVMGGFLFGGPIGFVNAAVNTIAEAVSGHDIGDSLAALAFGSREGAKPPTTLSAQASRAEAAIPANTDLAPYDATVTLSAVNAPIAPAEPPVANNVARSQPSQALTGTAALQAFLADVGAVGAPAPASVSRPSAEPPRYLDRRGRSLPARAEIPSGRTKPVLPGAAFVPAAAVQLRPLEDASPSSRTLGPAADGSGNIAARMRGAIEKYQVLMRSRRIESAAGESL